MVSRGTASWLVLLVVVAFAACAADFAVFDYRQHHGDVLDFVSVSKYQAVSLGNGHYRYEYFGKMDVPCVQSMLPHQNRSPCWWVVVNQENWKW